MMAFSTMSGRFRCVPQLVGADVVGGVLRPLVDLPADDLVGARRARVVALRRPHHPFAVGAVEQRDDQLARLEVPQAHGLVGAARDQQPAVGRGRHGPHVALVADEFAELLAVQRIGHEDAVAAAGDDGLAVGREGVGAMLVAIGGGRGSIEATTRPLCTTELDAANFTAHWIYTSALAQFGREDEALEAAIPALAMSGRHTMILTTMAAIYSDPARSTRSRRSAGVDRAGQDRLHRLRRPGLGRRLGGTLARSATPSGEGHGRTRSLRDVLEAAGVAADLERRTMRGADPGDVAV